MLSSFPTRSPQPLGDRDTIVHARAIERDKGNDIRRADARMLARVIVEVNQFRRRF